MDVQMPDGTLITGVPEGTTKAQLQEKYAAHIGGSTPTYSGPIARNQGAPAVSTGPENPEMQANQDLDLATSALFNATPIGPAIRSAGYLAGLPFGKQNEAQAWADKHLTYHAQDPRTNAMLADAGSRISKVTAPIDHAVGNAWNDTFANAGTGGAAVKSLLEDTSTMAGHVANVLPLVAGATSALSGLKGSAAISNADKVAQASYREPTPVEALNSAGYSLRPSDVAKTEIGGAPSLPARALETATGSHEMSRELSNKNAAVSQNLAIKEGGLDTSKSGGRITKDVLDSAKAPNNAVYEEISKVGGSPVDVSTQIGSIDVKGSAPETLAYKDKLASDYGNVGSSEGIVADVRRLRQKASDWINSDSVLDQEKGFIAKKTANILEDVLEQRAMASGDTGLVNRFQTARQNLAKIHVIEDSTRAGIIDPSKVLLAKKHGEPVTGGLSLIAYAAEHAPDVTKHPQSFSTASTLHAPTSLSDAASGIARNLGGRAILNGPYQSALAGPHPNPLGAFYPKAPDPSAPIQFGGYLPRPGEVPLGAGQDFPSVDANYNIVYPPGWKQQGARGQLALPSPETVTPQAAVAPDATTLGPQGNLAAASHPGYSGDLRTPAPPLSVAEGAGVNPPADNSGLALADALMEANKKRVENRSKTRYQENGRALKLWLDSQLPASKGTPLKGNEGAQARGDALQLVLEGKYDPKRDRTLKQLAKAVEEAKRSK